VHISVKKDLLSTKEAIKINKSVEHAKKVQFLGDFPFNITNLPTV
jgi:hypothetical protein